MRILIHSRKFLPSLGGLEQVTHELARALVAHGHAVVVATDVTGTLQEDSRLGFDVVRRPSLRALAALARSFDLVHSSGHGMVAVLIARLARRPLVITHHGYQVVCLSGLGWHDGERCGYRLGRCFRLTWKRDGSRRALRQLARHVAARLTLRWAAAHVAVSRFVAGTLGIPGVEVVFNSVDSSFHVAPATGPRESFLFAGRFVREKGVSFLLEAFARYKELGGACALDLAGTGPLEVEYRRLVNQLGIQGAVRFVGALGRESLARAYLESLAVLVPSLWDEAFGMVAAEAICSGRAVIVTRTGGLPEVVEGGGITVPPGDVEAWARAMLRLERDPEFRQALEAGLPTLAKRFTRDGMVTGYLEIFDRVLRQARTVGSGG